jgi:hypothetical protein
MNHYIRISFAGKNSMCKMNSLIINLLIIFCLQVLQVVKAQKIPFEIIADPTIFSPNINKVVQHADLPPVTDSVSITLRLNLQAHNGDWACVFHKGIIKFAKKAYFKINLRIYMYFRHQ